MTASMTLPPAVDIETAAALADRHAPVTIIDVCIPVEFDVCPVGRGWAGANARVADAAAR